jgi:hypothetical protein
MTDLDFERELTEHLHRRAGAVILRADLEAVELGITSREFVRTDDPPARRPGIGALVGAAAAALAVVAAVSTLTRDELSSTVTEIDPSTTVGAVEPSTTVIQVEPSTTLIDDVPPTSAFVGSWTSIDVDGSAQTMELALTDDGAVQMDIHDDAGTVCSGAAATIVGAGRLGGDALIIAVESVTCDDGSEPLLDLDEEPLDITFIHDPARDVLADDIGVEWSRPGSVEPAPGAPGSVVPSSAIPSSDGPTSGAMWPQSSVEEVREAQALADADDPSYTWQVEPQLSGDEWWSQLRRPGAEIAERFLREELGWDEFLFNTYAVNSSEDGVIRGVVYLRCATGETNLLYPEVGVGDALGADRCAPTVDELRYETVRLDLAQLDRRGRDGIWVVSRWATGAAFAQADSRAVEKEATARLEEFLEARIAGEAAERVEVNGPYVVQRVPLLYATTAGAPYERYEFDVLSRPQWPDGSMRFTVRLFADGGETVVEQQITWSGALTHDEKTTTENGKPVAVPYSVFDGEITLSAAGPWQVNVESEVVFAFNGMFGDEFLALSDDPLPVASGCEQGPVPTDAAALTRSIQSDPDLVVTAPASFSLAGADGARMDVTLAAGASVCESEGLTLVATDLTDGWRGRTGLDQGSRMRLFLLDLPEGLSTRMLAIAVVAPEARFEAVLEAAAPILASIEFHPGGP